MLILTTLAFFRKEMSLSLSTLMRTLLTKDLEEDLLKLKEDNKNQALTQFFVCYTNSFKILHTQYNINIIPLVSIHMSSPMNTYQREDTFREEIISSNRKQYINFFSNRNFPSRVNSDFFRVFFFFFFFSEKLLLHSNYQRRHNSYFFGTPVYSEELLFCAATFSGQSLLNSSYLFRIATFSE